MPWIGYFAMINSVDEFIFLDDAQFSKRSWQQRNKLKAVDGEKWVSVPVKTKNKFEQSIKESEISDFHKFQKKTLNFIKQTYTKSDYIDEVFFLIEDSFNKCNENLCDLNINLIKNALERLSIKTPLMLSSEITTNGSKADKLVELCLNRGASLYLSAPGSKVYIDESNAFSANNVEVIYHEYHHPTYQQLHGQFIPYLSVYDLLFNIDPISALNVIKSGITPHESN